MPFNRIHRFLAFGCSSPDPPKLNVYCPAALIKYNISDFRFWRNDAAAAFSFIQLEKSVVIISRVPQNY